MMLNTERLKICKLTHDMAADLCRLSQDGANRAFLVDEVYETEEEAARVIELVLDEYDGDRGPFVYAVTLQDGTYIGHVEAALTSEGDWEVGFHIGEDYTGNGYASEALRAFLPFICEKLGMDEVLGIALEENIPSWKTLEKSGFRLEYEGQGRWQGFTAPIRRYVWTPSAPPDIDDFWHDFVKSQGFHPQTEYREAICFDEHDRSEPMLALVLNGKKTAACSSVRYWEWLECDLPEPGDFSIVTDREGRPRCVIETMDVLRMPLSRVTAELVMQECGVDELTDWTARQTALLEKEAVKLRYEYKPDPEVLFEIFEVVWQA